MFITIQINHYVYISSTNMLPFYVAAIKTGTLVHSLLKEHGMK